MDGAIFLKERVVSLIRKTSNLVKSEKQLYCQFNVRTFLKLEN